MPNYIFGLYPDTLRDEKSGAGAISVEAYTTRLTAGGAVANQLADVDKVGQLKKIVLEDSAGISTITPATFADGSTVALAAAAGNYVELMWIGDAGWRVIDEKGATIA